MLNFWEKVPKLRDLKYTKFFAIIYICYENVQKYNIDGTISGVCQLLVL